MRCRTTVVALTALNSCSYNIRKLRPTACNKNQKPKQTQNSTHANLNATRHNLTQPKADPAVPSMQGKGKNEPTSCVRADPTQDGQDAGRRDVTQSYDRKAPRFVCFARVVTWGGLGGGGGSLVGAPSSSDILSVTSVTVTVAASTGAEAAVAVS